MLSTKCLHGFGLQILCCFSVMSWIFQGMQKIIKVPTGTLSSKWRLKKIIRQKLWQPTWRKLRSSTIFLPVFNGNLSSYMFQDLNLKAATGIMKSLLFKDKTRFKTTWWTKACITPWELMSCIPESWENWLMFPRQSQEYLKSHGSQAKFSVMGKRETASPYF